MRIVDPRGGEVEDVPAVVTVCPFCGKAYPYLRETRGCDSCGRDDVTVRYDLARP